MAGVSEAPVARIVRRWETETFFFTLVLAVLAFFVLYPLFLLLLNSFQTALPGHEATFSLEGWRAALTEPGMRSAVFNTITLTITREFISFPVAIFLAWLLARTDLPGRDWFEFLFCFFITKNYGLNGICVSHMRGNPGRLKNRFKLLWLYWFPRFEIPYRAPTSYNIKEISPSYV